jgi:hypothetical protein
MLEHARFDRPKADPEPLSEQVVRWPSSFVSLTLINRLRLFTWLACLSLGLIIGACLALGTIYG